MLSGLISNDLFPSLEADSADIEGPAYLGGNSMYI